MADLVFAPGDVVEDPVCRVDTGRETLIGQGRESAGVLQDVEVILAGRAAAREAALSHTLLIHQRA